ncbi:hypothetical protein TcCL_NonESM09682 [Trypanosoma cruzi]|nr:hypothetical protein TcCL_NonESM09682 [Trypanosoma cruzi]
MILATHTQIMNGILMMVSMPCESGEGNAVLRCGTRGKERMSFLLHSPLPRWGFPVAVAVPCCRTVTPLCLGQQQFIPSIGVGKRWNWPRWKLSRIAAFFLVCRAEFISRLGLLLGNIDCCAEVHNARAGRGLDQCCLHPLFVKYEEGRHL